MRGSFQHLLRNRSLPKARVKSVYGAVQSIHEQIDGCLRMLRAGGAGALDYFAVGRVFAGECSVFLFYS